MAAVQGFAGLTAAPDGLRLDPHLPATFRWKPTGLMPPLDQPAPA
jgi:hypothetical protein